MKNNYLFLSTLLIVFTVNLNAQYNLEECKLHYIRGQYNEIIPSLQTFKGLDYKQNSFLINYMLGTSYCRAQLPKNGARILNWMKQKYDLDYKLRTIIDNEITKCGSNFQASVNIPLYTYRRNSVAGISSKVYKPEMSGDKVFSYEQNKLIDSSYFEIYVQRIIPKDSSININFLKTPAYKSNKLKKYYISTNFIVFSGRNRMKSSLNSVSNQLEEVLDFYHDFFQLELPCNYINVYILDSFEGLKKFAKNFHKIELRHKAIGYTFESDNSIAAFFLFTSTGTLKHELLHLLLHNNFQAIPPWMDEGLSSLYEKSRFDGSGNLLGKKNWRGELLHLNWEKITEYEHLKLHNILTNFDWKKANQNRRYIEFVYAVSRYFFLFLQEQEKLKEYYRKVSVYSPNSNEGFFITELEKIFDDSYENIEKQFYIWLEDIVKL